MYNLEDLVQSPGRAKVRCPFVRFKRQQLDFGRDTRLNDFVTFMDLR